MEIDMLSNTNSRNNNNNNTNNSRASSSAVAIKSTYRKNNSKFHSSLLFCSSVSLLCRSRGPKSFINFALISYLVAFLFLNHIIVQPLEAVNQIGCLVDASVCEYDEFCLDDSLLGICLDNNFENEDNDDNVDEDNPVSETLRSEQETPLYLNSPIRIHKYDIANSDDSENFANYVQNLNAEDSSPSSSEEQEEDNDNSNNEPEYLKNFKSTYLNSNELDDDSAADDTDSLVNRISAAVADDASDDFQNDNGRITIMKKDFVDNDDDDDEDDNSNEALIDNIVNNDEAYVKLERLLKTTDLESERARLDENEKETLQEVNNRVDDLMDTDDDAAADESLLDELASRNRKVPLSKRSLMDLFKESDYDSAARNLASDDQDLGEQEANELVRDQDDEVDEEADKLLERVNHDTFENNLIDRAISLLDEEVEPTDSQEQKEEEDDDDDVEETEVLKKRAVMYDQRDFLSDGNPFEDDIDVYDLEEAAPNSSPSSTSKLLDDEDDDDDVPDDDPTLNDNFFRIINSINKNSNQINTLLDATADNEKNSNNNNNNKKLNDYFYSASVEDSVVFLETNKKLNDEERKEFLNFISTQLSIPLDWITNITVKNNFILFKLNNPSSGGGNNGGGGISDYEKLIEKLGTIANNQNRFEYLHDKGIEIVKYGVENENLQIKTNFEKHFYNRRNKEPAEALATHRLLFRHPFNIDPNSKQFFQLTLLTCSVLSVFLLLLLALFVYKRRAYLSGKLIKDVKSPVYRINFEDDESLISSRGGSRQCRVASAWRSMVEFFKCSLLRFRKSPATTATAAAGSSSSSSQLVTSQDYQDLCRQRMQSTQVGVKNETTSNKSGNVSPTISIDKYTFNSADAAAAAAAAAKSGSGQNSPRSSTSSWNEEPIKSFNIDITTGHIILTYMEEHLNDKNKLHDEWNGLCNYEPEPNSTEIGNLPENITKNRYSNILPYDHTRVKLKNKENDYINANYIIDDDPKNASYIAAQGPLMHTTNDFWHMVWQEESVVIVSLCRTIEYGSAKCHQFWPANGFSVYDKFEIHLVSEHVWCEDYLVRNFFLKNLELNQTRTVTQFHYLTWSENGVPQNIKSFLDFRRKVNKSFKAKSSPLIVHCNDGVARTGTYVLIDMVLNKIAKGSKEIDIAATLEYLRDQRPGMIKNKIQFEYSFAVITEELHNMLKALRQ